jgi:hypothetical protein
MSSALRSLSCSAAPAIGTGGTGRSGRVGPRFWWSSNAIATGAPRAFVGVPPHRPKTRSCARRHMGASRASWLLIKPATIRQCVRPAQTADCPTHAAALPPLRGGRPSQRVKTVRPHIVPADKHGGRAGSRLRAAELRVAVPIAGGGHLARPLLQTKHPGHCALPQGVCSDAWRYYVRVSHIALTLPVLAPARRGIASYLTILVYH